jgi:cyclin A
MKIDEDKLFDCATRILSMAKNFEKLYPNLENLKKFHSFNLDNENGEKPKFSKL